MSSESKMPPRREKPNSEQKNTGLSSTSAASNGWNSDWSCIWADDSEKLCELNIESTIEEIQQFSKTLKDDKRSLVKQGYLFGDTVIAKQPKDKNNRTWIRFLSLFRDSEARTSLQTLSDFESYGIASVKPICVFEKRINGFLVDSWLIYVYREGKPTNHENLAEIVTLLQKLHNHGYWHDDPNFGNFLIDSERSGCEKSKNDIFLIDCKGKKRVGTISDCFDFMLLSLRNPSVGMNEVIELAELDTDSFGFKLASFYVGYKNFRTNLKKYIRK